MPTISVRQLSKYYGTKCVIENISFDISDREFVALIGPSGSGKSTLLNLIGLLETVDEGTITIDGEILPQVNSKKATHLRRNVLNYLFQSNALIPNESVGDNLMLALHYTNLTKEEKDKKIKTVLSKVHMESFLESRINELSGGEQQRIAIARAILKPGELILADEPTGSLDPQMAQTAFELLKLLRDEYGKTIILVTHNMDQAQQCDRIIDLERLKDLN
ncbi:ATP-binding cassette domain-containing protein [Streptococcus sp. LQJ-218]|uniref:ABC transporter ATP-binding protein n=1 Tax=Streptococcus sp. LQJ-218 TaxID=2283190 RepID=UPI000E3C649E|nr:ATP-binding cassette domain-containing protein [Streptococcus sp. LQJ-218]TAA68562.1 ATP-binding cassette domain-containing protein [Streptococcus sp. LQJ-218]